MSVSLSDPWPYVRQAVVRQLRANLVLSGELGRGDWSEGVAPKDTPFPRGIYSLHYAPIERDWTGFVALCGFDIVVFSKDSKGEAARLAQLAFTSLSNVRLQVTGQTSFLCTFVSDIHLTDAAPDGTDTVWQAGGIYAALAPQSNPSQRTLVVTLSSTIG